MPFPALAAALIPALGKLLERAIPDAEARARAQAELTQSLLAGDIKELEAAASVIRAEAEGESWLQRNWRPLLMCVFGAIVANNYVVAPYMQALFSFSVELAVPEPMWELLKLGVGGYILGRSSEKAIRAWRDGGK
jgi:hypothetical protein